MSNKRNSGSDFSIFQIQNVRWTVAKNQIITDVTEYHFRALPLQPLAEFTVKNLNARLNENAILLRPVK